VGEAGISSCWVVNRRYLLYCMLSDVQTASAVIYHDLG
jgi:hypothetical protein